MQLQQPAARVVSISDARWSTIGERAVRIRSGQAVDGSGSAAACVVPRESVTYTKVRRRRGIVGWVEIRILTDVDSAFESLAAERVPPHRRITQDDAPSMMPVAAGGSHVQGQVSQMQATGQGHLSQSQSNQSGKGGSAGSFASVSGGGGPARKKARLG